MLRLSKAELSLLTLFLLIVLLFVGCSNRTSSEKVHIATGSSLIEDIITGIGGDRIEVVNIIPPGMCPGHFDVSPQDIQKISDSRAFFIHEWQGEKFSDAVPESSGSIDLKRIIISIEGNWMVPKFRSEAIERILEELKAIDPDNAKTFEERAAEMKSETEEFGEQIMEKIAASPLKGKKALCGEMQKGFLLWIGVEVIDVYGRSEDITPQRMKELVDAGKSEGAEIVIDNLQSDANAGKSIAEEIGIPQVTLSNFPGGITGTSGWAETLENNVMILFEAIGWKQ